MRPADGWHQDVGHAVRVAVLRSPRLEALLGARVDDLAAEHIHGLVSGGIQEEFDLDFKATLYGRGDSDRRALAGDVAAMANTAGGLVVIGVEEDAQARATAAPGVEITDGEIGRIRQVVASLTAPMPHLDIIPVADQALGDGHGFLVIAVPRSTGAPHAVLVNDALRYPRRNGATTRYLSEAEVATAYRERLVGLAEQEQRVLALETAARERVNDDAEPWVLISLVPDLPGELLISQETFTAFQQRTLSEPATVVPTFVSYGQASVGQRCFVADDATQRGAKANSVVLRLQTDGAGTYGHRLHHLSTHRGGPGDGESLLVWDELLVISIISGLLQLGRHARDHTAAGGNALVRATLVGGRDSVLVEIGHTRHHGFPESRSTHAQTAPVSTATVSVPLDDVAAPGPPLLAVAAVLAGEIAQAFGVIDLGQLTPGGAIGRLYWASDAWQVSLVKWAKQNDIEVIDK